MIARQFQFEWDEEKAAKNLVRHDVPFELASTVFNDPNVLTVADLVHSESEERWFSIGCASNGSLLSVVHLWLDINPEITNIRLISARKATRTEIGYYQVGL